MNKCDICNQETECGDFILSSDLRTNVWKCKDCQFPDSFWKYCEEIDKIVENKWMICNRIYFVNQEYFKKTPIEIAAIRLRQFNRNQEGLG